MAGFCAQCGSQMGEGNQFCVKCGTRVGDSGKPAALNYPPEAAAPAVKRMSTAAKLAISAAVLIFLGCALGVVAVFYAAHRVSEKFHEATSSITGSGTQTSAASSSPVADPCRYLSKQDVGSAIGLEIVATQSDGESCSYLAKGNQADMTAKHMAAMAGKKGADAHAQKMIHDFAGGLAKSFATEQPEHGSDTSGNVPVLAISIQQRDASDAEMHLNEKVMSGLDATAEHLEGIGDRAFVTGDSMMMIRKGDRLIRIMYMTCPCSTSEIKPLALKLVASL